MSIADGRERNRRIIHVSFGALAFLVDSLGRGWSVALAGAAFLYNAWLAPRFGLDRGYRRVGEPRFAGLTTYPLAVLALLILAPLPVATGAWVVLAALDPVAAAVGSRFPRPAVPGNPGKSLLGMGAGFVAGALGCFAILRFVGFEPAVRGALAAAGAGALAEALPLRIDDNLPVAAAAGLALFLHAA